MRVYISGKITGIEDTAHQLFEAAEIELQKQGFKTVNPLKLNHVHDKSWESYMKEDVKALCDCDAIYLLDNWKDSKGAKIERKIAEYLGLIVLTETVK